MRAQIDPAHVISVSSERGVGGRDTYTAARQPGSAFARTWKRRLHVWPYFLLRSERVGIRVQQPLVENEELLRISSQDTHYTHHVAIAVLLYKLVHECLADLPPIMGHADYRIGEDPRRERDAVQQVVDCLELRELLMHIDLPSVVRYEKLHRHHTRIPQRHKGPCTEASHPRRHRVELI